MIDKLKSNDDRGIKVATDTSKNVMAYAGYVLRNAQIRRHKEYLHNLDAVAFMHEYIFTLGSDRPALSIDELDLFRASILLDEIEAKCPLITAVEAEDRFKDRFAAGGGHDTLEYMLRALHASGLVMKSVKGDQAANAWTDGESIYDRAESLMDLAETLFFEDALNAVALVARKLGLSFSLISQVPGVYSPSPAEITALQRSVLDTRFKHLEQYISKENFDSSMVLAIEKGEGKLLLYTILDALQQRGFVLSRTSHSNGVHFDENIKDLAMSSRFQFKKRYEEILLTGLMEGLKECGYEIAWDAEGQDEVTAEEKFRTGQTILKIAKEYVREFRDEIDVSTGLTKYGLNGAGVDIVEQLLEGLEDHGAAIRRRP